ncbi:flavodoxin [uncultured Methanobrevibacter sp.]|uniref:flavodoxin n=1 Tax=uncultured Methanobrevibacter sp. TaxID=253161 RepID=UPI00262306A2|nr:flavodoxin [uncultured Methanobrevibacter sp.]
MSKDLILYFSRAGENYYCGDLKTVEKGNTEVIVDYIKEITDADVFKVEPEIPYPEDYSECTEIVKKENDPRKLKETLVDISNYEEIYIGFPNWWGTLPNVLALQLENLDFKDKIVKPFVTHEGSGFGKSKKDLKKLCKGADIRKGLEIKGSDVLNSRDKVRNWINNDS